jgi:hypothetical protein
MRYANGDGVLNYLTLLGPTRSLRGVLSGSPARFAGTGAVPVGSAVSTGVRSECPAPTLSTG